MSPHIFKTDLAAILGPLQASWKRRGLGAVLDGTVIDILTYADDIVLLADTRADLKKTSGELLKALEEQIWY